MGSDSLKPNFEYLICRMNYYSTFRRSVVILVTKKMILKTAYINLTFFRAQQAGFLFSAVEMEAPCASSYQTM